MRPQLMKYKQYALGLTKYFFIKISTLNDKIIVLFYSQLIKFHSEFIILRVNEKNIFGNNKIVAF